VLGRQVEVTTLNLIVELAKSMGARHIIGEYRPSKKNAMVKDHYVKLGFEALESYLDGRSLSSLEIARFVENPTPILLEEAKHGG